MDLKLYNNSFVLSPDKALFWIETKMLIISDAHLTKESHFRKNGIAVPTGILQNDLIRISKLIQHFNPKVVLFLGDMFHSEANEGLNEFLVWREIHSKLDIQLVVGNHDILHRDWYQTANIKLIPDEITIDNIILSHDKLSVIPEGKINFFGHLHPAIRLQGIAKQSLQLPCFYCDKQHMILPAFGKFTGFKTIAVKKNAIVFAIGDNQIFKVN